MDVKVHPGKAAQHGQTSASTSMEDDDDAPVNKRGTKRPSSFDDEMERALAPDVDRMETDQRNQATAAGRQPPESEPEEENDDEDNGPRKSRPTKPRARPSKKQKTDESAPKANKPKKGVNKFETPFESVFALKVGTAVEICGNHYVIDRTPLETDLYEYRGVDVANHGEPYAKRRDRVVEALQRETNKPEEDRGVTPFRHAFILRDGNGTARHTAFFCHGRLYFLSQGNKNYVVERLIPNSGRIFQPRNKAYEADFDEVLDYAKFAKQRRPELLQEAKKKIARLRLFQVCDNRVSAETTPEIWASLSTKAPAGSEYSDRELVTVSKAPFWVPPEIFDKWTEAGILTKIANAEKKIDTHLKAPPPAAAAPTTNGKSSAAAAKPKTKPSAMEVAAATTPLFLDPFVADQITRALRQVVEQGLVTLPPALPDDAAAHKALLTAAELTDVAGVDLLKHKITEHGLWTFLTSTTSSTPQAMRLLAVLARLVNGLTVETWTPMLAARAAPPPAPVPVVAAEPPRAAPVETAAAPPITQPPPPPPAAPVAKRIAPPPPTTTAKSTKATMGKAKETDVAWF